MSMGFGDSNGSKNGDGNNQIVDCHVSERDGRLVGGGDNELVGDDGNGSEKRLTDYVDGGGHGGYAGDGAIFNGLGFYS